MFRKVELSCEHIKSVREEDLNRFLGVFLPDLDNASYGQYGLLTRTESLTEPFKERKIAYPIYAG